MLYSDYLFGSPSHTALSFGSRQFRYSDHMGLRDVRMVGVSDGNRTVLVPSSDHVQVLLILHSWIALLPLDEVRDIGSHLTCL